MLFTYAATVVPDTGNVSANVYLIAVIIAAVLIVGAIAAGIISKKKKK
ncbi:MAG: LPXTG cell wall anchor domain-containing protein [Oscillospiraceae bacterium]|nr:LPXTG cell wall anchor domain-containing protein [Oscillospiraceae bacterium]